MQHKIRSKESTLAQQCYEQLQEDIVNGIFKSGEKLKLETLKKRFAVGQSPIREALSRLVASGLVQTEDNKGFNVTTISEADIRDIYRTFCQIETIALIQAIELGDDIWEAQIVGALHQLSLVEHPKSGVSYNKWRERNYAFHVALISGCDSPCLLQIRADLYRRFDRYCRIAFSVTKESLDMNHEEHKKLADAVLKRDVSTACKLMRHHLTGSLEDVIKSLKDNNIL